MNYTMTVTIADPNTLPGMNSDITLKLDCSFAYDPEQYGNGYLLKIKCRGEFENHIDLRYDTIFRSNKKEEYLEKWARSYWSGENGAYAVKELKIEKV